MTRRGLLKFLGLAPVGLPMAVAAAQSITPGVDVVSMKLAPFSVPACDIEFLVRREFAVEEICRGFMTVNEARALEGLPPCT